MPSITDNNKRIAKNAILLYLRMFFMMAISLYTSRIILATLGIEDYGLYNVIGGIIGLFSFISGTMGAGTQRYLNFSLGEGDAMQLQNVFNTCLNIHTILSIFIVLLAETIGLWFLYTQMNIPENRMTAAFWVYQFSIFTTIIMVLSVPYNAIIIAHEKMNAFAYISIIEASLKLAIVYLLLIGNLDKLILYSFLMFLVQGSIRIIYGIYCKKNFPETKFKLTKDKKLIKEMLSFTGWNLWGGCAYIAFTQGLNILLNIFFGASINAARGIAVQVQNTVLQFSTNFQTAINPQIIKSYAKKDYTYMHELIYNGSKYTFFLLLLITLPIFIETPLLLNIWLKDVPNYTIPFLRIILCITIIDSVSNPIMISATATGNVKLYQSVIGGILLLIVPISYTVLKLGGSPISVFIVHFTICIIAFWVRIYIIRTMINLSIKKYFQKVILKIILVGATSIIIPLIITYIGNNMPTLIHLIVVCSSCILSSLIFIYTLGLSSNEKTFITNKIKIFLKQKR